jgi:ATP-binding protein involved in chromosome partitioning
MSESIKNLILIASGKGGVGKSTVAVNLALAFAQSGHRTGLLDADVYGPSIPTMLGAAAKPETDGKHLLPIERHGLKLMSMGYLVEPEVAMIWRGPMLASAASQLLTDVDWGELDFLVLDLPPGTGDIQLTLAQKFKVTGAVLVTTPQEVALADVRRAKNMFDKVQITTLGLVENMSYFICPSCEARHEIFSHGGGERSAKAMGIDFLGRIPLEPKVREGGDAGVPLLVGAADSTSAQAFRDIAAAVGERARRVSEERAKAEAKRRILPIIPS